MPTLLPRANDKASRVCFSLALGDDLDHILDVGVDDDDLEHITLDDGWVQARRASHVIVGTPAASGAYIATLLADGRWTVASAIVRYVPPPPHETHQPPVWMREMYELADTDTQGAMALLIDAIDDLLWQGRMSDVDDVLVTLEIKRLNLSLLIGLLSICSAAEKDLQRYREVRRQVVARVHELAPTRAEALLRRFV